MLKLPVTLEFNSEKVLQKKFQTNDPYFSKFSKKMLTVKNAVSIFFNVKYESEITMRNNDMGMFVTIALKPKGQDNTVKFGFFDNNNVRLCTPTIDIKDLYAIDHTSPTEWDNALCNQRLLKSMLDKSSFTQTDKDNLLLLYNTHDLNKSNVYYIPNEKAVRIYENQFYAALKNGLTLDEDLIETIKFTKNPDNMHTKKSYDEYMSMSDSIKRLYSKKINKKSTSYEGQITYLLQLINDYADDLDEINISLNVINNKTNNEVWLYFSKKDNIDKAYTKVNLKNTNLPCSSNTIYPADIDDKFLELFKAIPYLRCLNNEFDDDLIEDLNKNSSLQQTFVLNDLGKAEQFDILDKMGDYLLGISKKKLTKDEKEILHLPETLTVTDNPKTWPKTWPINGSKYYDIESTTQIVNTDLFDVSRLNKPLNSNRISYKQTMIILQSIIDKLYDI